MRVYTEYNLGKLRKRIVIFQKILDACYKELERTSGPIHVLLRNIWLSRHFRNSKEAQSSTKFGRSETDKKLFSQRFIPGFPFS